MNKPMTKQELLSYIEKTWDTAQREAWGEGAPMTPHDMVQTLLMTGWRQVEIAKAVGLSQPNISRIASGKQGARWQYWAALQKLLDQPPPMLRRKP